jgi:putative heme-binding domain-containing protein
MKLLVPIAVLLGSVFLGCQNVRPHEGNRVPLGEGTGSAGAGASPGARFPTVAGTRFQVPDGFAVEEVLSPELAGSVVAIAFDSRGRLVLVRERGPIVTMVDRGDGSFEEVVFTEEVHTSQGIFFDGTDLLVVGIGPGGVTGLYRVADDDGDGRGDRVELIEPTFGGIAEHGPHAIYFGPDGYLYWTLGNMAYVRSSPAPLSPFRSYREGVLEPLTQTDARGHAHEYRAPGGTFVRTSRVDPAAEWEVVAGGFRNQYDGAFNLLGELFTFDSDMEWDRDLPWFRPIRSVHVVPGADYGWRTGSRKMPPYYIDTAPPMEEVGRGSPTGVIFYQAHSYPADYRDIFLQADWSRGRIVMGRLTRDGASYRQQSETFVYGTPLNVTDVDVGPDGNVYFALGGRMTQGGVYRVVYNGPNPMGPPQPRTPIDRVLTMPQPRSAFGRQLAREVRSQLGERGWRRSLTAEVRDPRASPDRRVRALELLHVYSQAADESLLRPLGSDSSWEVRAASTYYLGLHQTGSARAELVVRLADPDPFVQRRAAEALVRTGIHPAMPAPVSATRDIFPLLSSPDRFVRQAGREVLRRINRNQWQEPALRLEGYPQAAEVLLAYVQTLDAPSTKDVTLLLNRQLELLRAGPSEHELRQLVRVIQLTMLEDQGLTFASTGSGASAQPGQYPQITRLLLDRFPAADPGLSQEITRVLAYLRTPELVGRLAAELHDPNNSREQQIFYAYALSRLDAGPGSWDDDALNRTTSWFEKVNSEAWKGGGSFAGYMNIIRDGFLARLPEPKRALASERLAAMARPQLAGALTGPAAGGGGGGGTHGTLSMIEMEEELIYNPELFTGQPAAGVEAYRKALCATCHTFGDIGMEFGPDLTTVGQRFSRADLVRKIMRPNEYVSDLWMVHTVTRTDGGTLAGTVYREDDREVVLQVVGGAMVTIPRTEIASMVRSEASPMPAGLLGMLSMNEARDLILLLQAGVTALPAEPSEP